MWRWVEACGRRWVDVCVGRAARYNEEMYRVHVVLGPSASEGVRSSYRRYYRENMACPITFTLDYYITVNRLSLEVLACGWK